MAKSSSAERYRLRDGFSVVRNALLDPRYADRLDRTLGYFALSADRRLPIGLMDHSLRAILDMPFEKIAGMPGIGQKKLAALIMLLRRALEEQPQVESLTLVDEIKLKQSTLPPDCDDPVDPSVVSESTWEQWCATVRCHQLEGEQLGRLAPSLNDLPTVIWTTPLSDYLPLSLAALRDRKTYGEKRVRVVLEVFRAIHQVLGKLGQNSGLNVRLMPKFVQPLEDWFAEASTTPEKVDLQDVRQNLALPLLNQLALDSSPTVPKMVESRLGIEGPPETVRGLADRHGVTRARVYQMLDTCHRMMAVRWPAGRAHFALLDQRMGEMCPDREALAFFRLIRELFYPSKVAITTKRSLDDVESEVAQEV